MKTTRSTIHRLQVGVECGCTATAEYNDVGYATRLCEPRFAPCAKHLGVPGVEFIQQLLFEFLDEQAAISSVPPVPTVLTPMEAVRAARVGATVAQPAPDSKVAEALPAAAPVAAAPPRPATPPRPQGSHRPTGRPSGGSSGGGGFARSAAHGGSSASAAALTRMHMESLASAAPMEIDIDGSGVDEDPRVTNFIGGYLDEDPKDEDNSR